MALPTKKILVTSAFLSIVSLALVDLSVGAHTQNRNHNKGDVARGKYLVEEVAKCPECHTPRDAQGNLDRQVWLQGAPIWITPVRPIQNWADTVPPLAGLPSLTDAQASNVLERGMGPEGEALRPPMHTYHMAHDDAQAIIAYLRTLPVEKH